MAELRHSIKAVSRRTGLSPHVIRVWERRYGAVNPVRTGTNRRLYSDDEVVRLDLLRKATQAGHSIGNIAQLPTDQLSGLGLHAMDDAPAVPPKNEYPEDFVEESVAAIKHLDTRRLQAVLSKAVVVLGQHGLVERVAAPLARTLGDLWRSGVITAAHEHFASSILRDFIFRNSKPFAVTGNSPTLVVATPAGQLHELGAVMAAALAGDLGWNVVYLGPSLPASEIAGAALQNQARAVALSVVYPADDPNLGAELENLRKYLPDRVEIIVGGRAAASYGESLAKIGVQSPRELRDFCSLLDQLRSAPAR